MKKKEQLAKNALLVVFLVLCFSTRGECVLCKETCAVDHILTMLSKELQAAATPYFFISHGLKNGSRDIRLVDTGRGQRP